MLNLHCDKGIDYKAITGKRCEDPDCPHLPQERLRVFGICYKEHINVKQPILRIEDRLFYRGWVRSAMATRNCKNINLSKYFMAVRPCLTKKVYQELFGLESSKQFLEKFRQVHNLKISNRLLRSKSFFQKNIAGFICSVCVPFLGS